MPGHDRTFPENPATRSCNSFKGLPAAGDLVAVDPTGEASEAFSGLRPHYGYGLQWGWPAPSRP